MLGAIRFTVATAADDGVSHISLFGADDDGRAVFIKVEEEPGRLATEAAALQWAASHAIPVPTVLGYGPASVGGTDRIVLITERVPGGTRPVDPSGWRQMGAALARVADVPVDGCPLKSLGNTEFADQHLRRLDSVRHLLSRGLAADLEQAIERTRARAFEPVFTHGDPGGGNFLCTQDGGVLLDWESATSAENHSRIRIMWRTAALPSLQSRGFCRISKAFIDEGAGDLLAVLLGHTFATRNGVPPSSHARFHFIDYTRSVFALK